MTACADPDQAAAARLAAIGGVAVVYASVEELLQHAEVDAILVATSHDTLQECAFVAFKAEKYVLAEKPIGRIGKEAVELKEAAARFSVCFMAGYSCRYIAAWQKVRELPQAGPVGEIRTITGTIGIGPLSAGWRASPETGGRLMLCVESHLVDQILRYLDDDPAKARANARYRAGTRAEETATFQIRFAQGNVTQPAGRMFSNIDIYGRLGGISFRGAGFSYGVEVLSSPPVQRAAEENSHPPDGGPTHPGAHAATGRVCPGDPRTVAAIMHGDRWTACAEGAAPHHARTAPARRSGLAEPCSGCPSSAEAGCLLLTNRI